MNNSNATVKNDSTAKRQILLHLPGSKRGSFYSQYGKRAFDIVISIILLLLFGPLMLALAILIKLESRGPMLIWQRRIGQYGHPFNLLKLRTMRYNPSETAEYKEVRGIEFEPRLTRIGRILRRMSLDELPQIWNVLKGDMSLVGPRPLPADDLAILDSDASLRDYLAARNSVKPGITGLYQLYRGTQTDLHEMLQLDFFYIDNCSVLVDSAVLFRVFPAILFGRGAY